MNTQYSLEFPQVAPVITKLSQYSTFFGLGVPKTQLFTNHYDLSCLLNKFEITQYNTNTWLRNSDFSDEPITDEEDVIKTAEITSLYDQINLIYDQTVDEQLKDKLTIYNNVCINTMNGVIEKMFNNRSFTFNPMEKFCWIHLLIACRHFPEILPNLIKSPYFNKDMLHKSDKYGLTPLIVAAVTSKEAIELFFENGLIVTQDLNELHTSTNATPAMVSCFNVQVFDYISKIPDVNLADMFLFACRYVPKTMITHILDNVITTTELFQSESNTGVTCLPIAAAYNTPALIPLIQSPHCTQQFVEKVYGNSGTVLNVLCEYNTFNINILKEFLEACNFITDNMFSNKCVNVQDKYIYNAMFQLCRNYEGLNWILKSENSKYVNIQAFNNAFTHISSNSSHIVNPTFNLLQIAYLTSVDMFKLVLNSDFYNNLLKVEQFDSLILTDMFRTNSVKVNRISEMVNIDKIYPKILHDKLNGELIINKFVEHKLFVTEELESLIANDPKQFLRYTSDSGVSMLFLLAVHYPTVLMNYLDCIDKEMLEFKLQDRTTFCAVCTYKTNTKNNKLLEKLIQLDVVDDDIISKDNTLDCIAYSNPTLLAYILEIKKLSKTTFEKNNIMFILLKSPIALNKNIAFTATVNHELFTEDMMLQLFEESTVLTSALKTGDISIVTTVLQHKYFNKQLFSQNCLSAVCTSKNVALVKLVFELELCTQEMFQSICLVNAGFSGVSAILEYVLKHKFCTQEIFNQAVDTMFNSDKIFGINLSVLEVLFDCPFNNNDSEHNNILNKFDVEGNNLLMMCTFKSSEYNSLILKMLQSDLCSYQTLLTVNNTKQNIMHIAKQEVVLEVVKSKHFNEQMLFILDSSDISCLNQIIYKKYDQVIHYILNNAKTDLVLTTLYNNRVALIHNEQYLNKVLNLEYVTKNTLLTKTSDNSTILHINKSNLQNVKLILESDKCSQELVEAVNKDNKTALLLNIDLWSVFKDSKWCSNKLLTTVSNDGVNILVLMFTRLINIETVKDLLNHPNASKELFLSDPNSQSSVTTTPLMFALKSSYYLNTVLESKLMDNECINFTKPNNSVTLLCYAVLDNNLPAVETLLNSPFDLTPSFNTVDSTDRNLLMVAASTSNVNVFNILINSKYVDKEMICHKNKYMHTVLTYVVHNVEMLQLLIKSNYWIPELVLQCDIDNDFVLVHAYRYLETVSTLVNDPTFAEQLINMVDNVGDNCCHVFARHSVKTVDTLNCVLNSPHFNKQLLQNKNRFGDTVYHVAARTSVKAIELIANGDHNLSNSLGQTPQMVALKHKIKWFDNSNSNIYSNIHSVVDNKNRSSLWYAARYDHIILEKMLKSVDPVVIKELLVKRDSSFLYTPLIIASKYNWRSVSIFAKYGYVNNETVCIGHSECGTALTIAAQFQPEAIKHLLLIKDSNCKLSWNTLDSVNRKGQNFIQIACKFNAKAVKYAIDSTYDLTDLIKNTDCIIIASTYQPDAIKHILDSKYASEDLFYIKVNNLNCVDHAYNFQPKALKHMIESKAVSNDVLNREDSVGYRLINKLRRIYIINSLDDLPNLNLTDSVNEYVESETDPLACNICCCYKTNIIFSPCMHTCCTGCAFKLKNCHLCRAEITKRHELKN